MQVGQTRRIFRDRLVVRVLPTNVEKLLVSIPDTWRIIRAY